MTDENYSRLMEKIASLPSGGITYKKINGRKYAYYQWREDGRQRSRRVKADELDALSEQIALRKGYQSILKEAQAGYGTHSSINNTSGSFRCIARTGRELDDFVKPVSTYKKRECYRQLQDYIRRYLRQGIYFVWAETHRQDNTNPADYLRDGRSNAQPDCFFADTGQQAFERFEP